MDPESISVSWKDIAGLDDVLQELRDTLILPVKNRKAFGSSQLLQPPKGFVYDGMNIGWWLTLNHLMFTFRCASAWPSRLWQDNGKH